MKKLKRKKSLRKHLQKEAYDLWKIYCRKRDGDECQVKKFFPNISINHSNILQVDHCFSRMIKQLFLDVANGTVICSTCNQAKGSGKISSSKKDAITIAVHEIVKKREGVDVYNRLLEIASGSTKGFILWKDIGWLEGQITILKDLLNAENAIKDHKRK